MIKYPGDLQITDWMIGLSITEFEYQAGTEMFKKQLYVIARLHSKTSAVETWITLL